MLAGQGLRYCIVLVILIVIHRGQDEKGTALTSDMV